MRIRDEQSGEDVQATMVTLICDDYKYTVLNDGTAEITEYFGTAKKVNIPNDLYGKKVTSIVNNAFKDCSNITSVTMPNSVKTIGDKAFYCCTNLESITLSNKVTSIGYGAFLMCMSLKNITIPNSVTSIGRSAFELCSKIKDVYYTGSKASWNKITIEVLNDSLINATIHYNYTPEEITVGKVKTAKFFCTDKAVKINWEKVNGAAGYRVYAYNTKTKKWDTAATVSASTLSFKQTGLKSGTTYKYKVKAYAKQDGKTCTRSLG